MQVQEVLLDSDIVIDFLMLEKPFAEAAKAVFRAIEQGKFKGFITTTAVTNIFYIADNRMGRKQALLFIRFLTEMNGMDILGVNKKIVLDALNSEMKDFEDAIQAFTAKQNAVNCIITRNIKDYKLSPVKAVLPEIFLEHI